MAEYIDKKTLIEKIQQIADMEWNKETGTSWANAFLEAADIIDNMPSADVQPVVRCKECKYNENGLCCESLVIHVLPNDFCSWGARTVKDE